MSNLVKAIMATQTQDRKYIKTSKLFLDVVSIEEKSNITYTPNIATLYNIRAIFESRATILDDDRMALSEAIRRSKQQIIEAIFGEFRQDFRMIEYHLYNYDFEKAEDALHNMEIKMFSDE